MILSLFNLVPDMIAILTDSINSQVAAPTNGPDCADTTDPLYPVCIGLSILDRTVFAGPAQHALTILKGAIGLWLILWAVDEFKKTVGSPV
jgi:hypothetical protein